MKSYISKILVGGAALMALGLTSCVGDLDQFPKDQTILTPDQFKENPKLYMGQVMGKCYSSIAISGQTGAGSSDISGLDNGRSCWSRAIFMLNEFTTDECSWIWKDSGVFDLVTDTWATNNENIFGTYSRLYTHIAVCNDFIRLLRNADDYGISLNAEEQAIAAQFELEARALRDLSYYYAIDLFGNAAWFDENMVTGEEGPQKSRAELFELVTNDLEDVYRAFPEQTPVYGRIGRDAIRALLAKFYLNAEHWTGTARWADCWKYCTEIINRHGASANNYGLAKDYFSLFCGNNDLFAPGGGLPDQNEILWNIPYAYQQTESYGGSSFLILAAISDQNAATPGFYGINGQWTCMHARTQFSEKFAFSAGVSPDDRAWLWLTENDGFNINNEEFTTYKDGYVPIKFTNVECDPATGEMPRWQDPETGLNRVGVYDGYQSGTAYPGTPAYTVEKGVIVPAKPNYGIEATATFANTDYPIIRLAEILLTAAEAHVRSHGAVGNAADALDYVNAVRRRAKVAEWNAAQLSNLNNMIDERGRELYWENCRRTDLIRFGLFTGNTYNWNWKNNVSGGSGISSHMDLFPIPTSVINSYSLPYKQNPGY